MVAPFPCNVVIGWRTWYSAGKDGFNNDIEAWTAANTVKVIGWTSKRVMSRDGVHEVEDTDHLKLMVPFEFVWGPKDLAVIPGRGEYLVEGIENPGAGFHGWKPGMVLSLLYQEG